MLGEGLLAAELPEANDDDSFVEVQEEVMPDDVDVDDVESDSDEQSSCGEGKKSKK